MNALATPRPSAAANATRTLAFLADLSQALAVSLDLRQTLSEAVNRIADFMQAEAASLFLLDAESGVLECRVCTGPVDITGLRLDVGQGVVGRAVAENASQIVLDAASDPDVWRGNDADTGFVTRSLLCVPLATAEGPIGAIEIINRRGGGPFCPDEAEALRLLAAPTALAINNARMAHDVIERQRLKREFDLARRMQKSLLPRRRRDDFPLLGVNLPAHEISGDFYDYFDLPDGRIGFVIGDVSGKGLDAALLMVRTASLLRWVGKSALAPSEWLKRVNDELCETMQDGRFVCALVGYCDRAARRVEFAGAGFPPALLHRHGEFSDFPSGGPPLGILPGMEFDSHVFELAGGALYFFSDGATDVRDAARRPIGAEGVRRLIAQHADAAPEPRMRALLGDLKRLKLVDDTTVLLIESPRAKVPEVLLDRTLSAAAEQLRGLRSALRRTLDAGGIAPALRDKLVLVVDEACANIIRHAYGANTSGAMHLRLTRCDDVLRFELSDDAPTIDPACVKPKPLGECRAGGLGVALIDSVMDEWHIESRIGGCGNRLILQKRVTAERSEP
ncbi:MAG: SpoIIE family protein phosphatase [Rhodanobacteraceae bacterium]